MPSSLSSEVLGSPGWVGEDLGPGLWGQIPKGFMKVLLWIFSLGGTLISFFLACNTTGAQSLLVGIY